MEQRHWVRDPFFLAINSGKTTIVRLLLAHGANVNHFIQGGGDSPLHVAIRHEDAETTRVLLEWNANVNIKGSQSPLLAAVKRQSLNIVRLLLEHDADVDSEDKTGANSLDIAIRKRDLPIFKMPLLLRQGASPNSEVLHGDILDLAIAAGDVDVANILSEDGTKFSSAKARSAYIAMSGKAAPESVVLAKQEYLRSLESSLELVVQCPAGTAGGKIPRRDPVPSCSRCEQEEDLEVASFRVGQEIAHSSAGPSPRAWCKECGYNFQNATAYYSCNSDYAFELSKVWLHSCLTLHKICRLSETFATTLPTRIIDVGPTDGSQEPFLWETSGQWGPYVTLSYRWAQNQAAITRKDTLQQHKAEILMSSLPQVMRDAVRITRRLAFRYLWIDALCIIQDSYQDWAAQSAQMSKIYRDSILTIAAIDVIEPTETCLNGPVHVGGNHGMRPLGCLDSRAWVVQEQLLSPRVVSYTTSGLFWDCTSLCASAAYPTGIPIRFDRDFVKRESRIFKEAVRTGVLVSINTAIETKVHSSWQRVVESYSLCSMTKESDKLIAMKGIADETAIVKNDEFLAGLWKKTLWKDLLWWVDLSTIPFRQHNGKPSRRSREFQAPTWSWASVMNPVSYQWPATTNNYPPGSAIEVIDTEVETDLSQHNIYGRLRLRGELVDLEINDWRPDYGTKHLKARPARATYAPGYEDHHQGYGEDRDVRPSARASDSRGRTEGATVRLPDTQDAVTSGVQGLIVARSRIWTWCLALVPTGRISTSPGGSSQQLGAQYFTPSYQRIGLLRWGENTYNVRHDRGIQTIDLV